MEIYQLITFVSVAESGSFSLSSKRLGRTQSAISQQIKTLEDELNVKLFVRNFRDVSLTEAGNSLLPFARQILNSCNNAKDHVTGLSGRVEGELNIGVGFAIEPYIRKALIEMMRLYPEVRINIVYSQAWLLNQQLSAHKLDVAFTMNDSYQCEGILSKPLVPIHIRAIMPKTHVLAKNKKLSFDDIIKHYVIMPDADDRVYSTIQKIMNVDLRKLRVRAVISDADAILNLIEDVGMITFLPSLYIADRPNLVAIPIEGLEKEVISKAHWMADTYQKKSAEIFIKLIEDFAIPYYKSIQF